MPSKTVSVEGSNTSLPIFVFSLLHAESLEVLEMFISNFSLYAHKEDVLIVNSTSPDIEKFKLSTKNSNRNITIAKGQPRKAHGETLLKGHIQNWKLAKSIIGSDEKAFIFITVASNSLFFRSYDKQNILDTMTVQSTQNISKCTGWQYSTIKANKSFLEAFGEEYSHLQVEGFTSWSGGWEAIEKKFIALDYPSHNIKRPICLEEVLPLPALAEAEQESTNIGFVRWSKYKRGRQFASLYDIWMDDSLDEHICLYKWFERDDKNLVSASVSDISLNSVFNKFYSEPRVKNAHTIEKIGLSRSFLDGLDIPSAVLHIGSYSWEQRIDSDFKRKVIRLNDQVSGISPYLYFEALSEGFQSKLTVNIEGDRIYIASTTDDLLKTLNSSGYFKLNFYAVLYVPVPNNTTELWLTDWADEDSKNGDFNSNSMLLNFGMFEVDGKYKRVQAIENSFSSPILKPFSVYNFPKKESKRTRYFGIPIIPNSKFSVSIRVK